MKTMLVPVDFSDVTELVLKTAGEWACLAEYRIHLLHVIPEEGDLIGYESGMQLLPRVSSFETPEDRRLMLDCREQLMRLGLEVTTRIVQGSPVLEILDEAATVNAALIVVGSHRHGMLHNLLLGSVCDGVVRRAQCPVLVVPIPEAAESKSLARDSVGTGS